MYLYVYFRKYTNIKVNYVPCDLLKTEEITGFCKAVKSLYPDGIDILVNNAGKKSFNVYYKNLLILMELEIAIRIYSQEVAIINASNADNISFSVSSLAANIEGKTSFIVCHLTTNKPQS